MEGRIFKYLDLLPIIY